MSSQVDHFDHRANEPADQFHPQHESFRAWLDAVAPADQAQKLRNRPKHRRRTNGNQKLLAPVTCVACGDQVDGRDIVTHLKAHRQAA